MPAATDPGPEPAPGPAPGLPATVLLTPGRWIRLPGTPVEVYLRGKFEGRRQVEKVLWCHDDQTPTGYWDLTAIYHRLYVRGVDIYGHPTTYTEAIRPPLRRTPRPRRAAETPRTGRP